MQERPILTVTLNPALDIAAHVPRLRAGPKLRLTAPRTDPGGGGINVARAVRILGGQARAFAALGGAMGTQLAGLLRAEGVELIAFDAPGETRHSLSVIEDATGRQYRFVLPGPDWDGAVEAAALAAIADAAPGAALVVLSGSQPPGVAEEFAQRLAGRLAQGAALIVDTSGAALERLLRAPQRQTAPLVLRMDRAEAEAAAGGPLPHAADTADFAARLVERGVARMVVLARGAEGNVLAAEEQRLICTPPEVEVVSAVGAGDSFTAGFVLALARGANAGTALQAGTAAAAAAVMTGDTELCRREDAERLLPGCVLRRL